MQKRNRHYAFEKGFEELRSIDQPKVRGEIMSVLSVTTDQAFGLYRRGERKIEALIYDAIGLVFSKYGVNSPWGFKEEAKSYATKNK